MFYTTDHLNPDILSEHETIATTPTHTQQMKQINCYACHQFLSISYQSNSFYWNKLNIDIGIKNLKFKHLSDLIHY